MTGAAGGPRKHGGRDLASYAIIAGAVWLGWEVIKVPLALRSPPSLALRLSPASPEVLQRAAEAELADGRIDNSVELSNASLLNAPFNARALRVRGLAEARQGRESSADEMLTLAGNWSLRDDPAHAWLVEHRLKRGDYASSFAHADTLVRRRTDLYPSIFRLFTVAAAQDPRSLPALVDLLSRNPPWRMAFFEHLHDNPAGAPVVGALAIALERTDAPLSAFELQRLYDEWIEARRIVGVQQIRLRLNRPPADSLLQNGDFEEALEAQTYPFGWRLGASPGVVSSIAEDDLRSGNFAFRLDYDGFGTGTPLEQMTMLSPASYVFSGSQRVESSSGDLRLRWNIVCAESGQVIPVAVAQDVAGSEGWTSFATTFTIPAVNCSLQWLRLSPLSGDRRTHIAVWYDNINIRQKSGRSEETARTDR